MSNKNKTIKEIKDKLRHSLSDLVISSDRDDVESLSNGGRDSLIDFVYESQLEEVIDRFSKKEPAKIKGIGTFKIKEGRRIALDLKSSKLSQRGFANDGQVDKEIYNEVKKEVTMEVKNKAIERREQKKFSLTLGRVTGFKLAKK